MLKICQECGKSLRTSPSLIARGGGKYCSVGCFQTARRTKVEQKCLICGKSRMIKPSNLARGAGKYCSRECYRKKPTVKVERECLVCGSPFKVAPSVISDGGGKFCSIECRGRARSGENHHNWKGGITPKNHLWRTSPEYVKWRKSVLARDNYTCQDCGDRSYKGRGERVILHVHHIFSFADFPELRYEVWNGVTLCRVCHAKLHPAMAAQLFEQGVRAS